MTNVPDVRSKHLLVDTWQNKLKKADTPLMTQQQIAAHNAQLHASNPHVNNPLDLPDTLSKKQLLSKISRISKIPSSQRFNVDGDPVSKKDWQEYQQQLNLSGVKASNPVKFALITSRGALRTFPTYDRVLNKGMDADLDRFQESGVFPGQVAALLHISKDKKWGLVQNYHYLAWLELKHLALATKDAIQAFEQNTNRLVITGDKVFTNHVPNMPQVSEVQLDMGVNLPLLSAENFDHQLYGQNPYASYVVQLPTRDKKGKLKLLPALIARNQDVNIGYLPFTRTNLVKQAFKFLGERYGWGHDYNARDCTGFVGEIYKSFGILMPRNSGQQGSGAYGFNTRFNKQTKRSAKLDALKNLQVGDMLYLPGHVVMYLGNDNGQPWVIHDVKGLAYKNQQGKLQKGTLNGVAVTPLLPLQLSANADYLDRIYNIKRIWQ